jgi:hypothetical protein
MRFDDWWRKADNTAEQSKTKPTETEQDVVYNWLERNTTDGRTSHQSLTSDMNSSILLFRFVSFRSVHQSHLYLDHEVCQRLGNFFPENRETYSTF